jgi:hypothetical protein
MRRLLPLPLLAVVLLAGCGGGATHTVRLSPAPTVVGHQCDAKDYAMQCALAQLPVPRLALPRGVQSVYGVDFAWGGPRSCSEMRAIGAHFAWSYWSYDSSGKNWTRSLVDQFHACGIATVGGWETTATRATQGYSAGVSDAIEASRQAAADGNVRDAIGFAVDCDCSGPSILAYFQGVHHVLGVRDDAYGGYYQVLYLYQHGVVGHLNFQTYAWSGGLWLPASIAPLEQYLNGSSFDNDRAIAANFGQWPYVPAPPPGPTPRQLAGWRHARDSSLRAYRHRHCVLPVLGPAGCGQSAWRVVHFQRLLDRPNAPVCFGKHAQRNAPVCQIVRAEVAVWSRAGASTDRAYIARNCEGIAGFGLPSNSKPCRALRQREDYFGARIQATLKEF